MIDSVILSLALTPLLLVDLTFTAEVAAGLARSSGANRKTIEPKTANTTVVVIPAHNEASVIGRTLDRLTKETAGTFQILVVADNCSDATADIARRHGIEVVERHDRERRGKGHALAFAREHLRQLPPEAVIVLDADCHSDGASLRQLAAGAVGEQRAIQAVNLIEPGDGANAMVQISTFAFMIKNLVRQRGLQRLAGGVHLTGTGMCLPWHQFDRADLATSSIVEDVRLGLELSRQGAAPQLSGQAFVWSPHAAPGDTLDQRQRWEGGYLALARKAAPAFIWAGVRSVDPRMLLAGLDLLIPPLALLALINVVVLLGTVVLAVAGISGWLPTILLAAAAAAMGSALLAAWWREGRRFLTPGALLRLPLYALWKVPMYLKMARRGAPTEWLRTRRPGAPPVPPTADPD